MTRITATHLRVLELTGDLDGVAEYSACCFMEQLAQLISVKPTIEISSEIDPIIAQKDAEIARLREALTKIKNWDLPATGKFWENTDGTISSRPMSYEAVNGSNGARRYIRELAFEALEAKDERA